MMRLGASSTVTGPIFNVNSVLATSSGADGTRKFWPVILPPAAATPAIFRKSRRCIEVRRPENTALAFDHNTVRTVGRQRYSHAGDAAPLLLSSKSTVAQRPIIATLGRTKLVAPVSAVLMFFSLAAGLSALQRYRGYDYGGPSIPSEFYWTRLQYN